MYTDTHFHYLETIQKGYSHDELLTKMKDAHISLAIDVSIRGHIDMDQRLKALKDYPFVYFSAGYHPGRTNSIAAQEAAKQLEPLLDIERVVAVGETGLDYYRDYGEADAQKQLFAVQLELAQQKKLPVIIHNRQASKDVIAMLQSIPLNASGIIHCFDADLESAHRFLDLGMYISFSGNITFKRNEELRKILTEIPDDRLLLETDSPYLTPEPKRGKTNHPGRIIHSYKMAAQCRNTTVEKLAKQVQENTKKLCPRIQ